MAAAAPAVPTALDTGALRGVQVLLVEDNQINHVVAAWGIEVTEVVGVAEAVQLSNELVFDVVLMGIQMPDMSGFKATVLLRHHPEAGRTSIKMLAHPANTFHTV